MIFLFTLAKLCRKAGVNRVKSIRLTNNHLSFSAQLANMALTTVVEDDCELCAFA